MFVNGKRIPVSYTLSGGKNDWSASLPASSVLSVIGGSKTASIAVQATDVNGNTDVKIKDLKFDLGDFLP